MKGLSISFKFKSISPHNLHKGFRYHKTYIKEFRKHQALSLWLIWQAHRTLTRVIVEENKSSAPSTQESQLQLCLHMLDITNAIVPQPRLVIEHPERTANDLSIGTVELQHEENLPWYLRRIVSGSRSICCARLRRSSPM